MNAAVCRAFGPLSDIRRVIALAGIGRQRIRTADPQT